MRQLYEYDGFVAAAYQKGGIAESALNGISRANEENRLFSEAALWKAEGKAPVRAKGVGREQIVSVYQVRGQPGAIFGRGLLAGRYFTEGEQRVCLLSRAAARALFGAEQVLGLRIEWEGREYAVAGILKGDEPLCAVPAKEGTAYDGAAAKKVKASVSSETAFGALEATLGGVGQQRVDGHLYYTTACLFYFFVLAALLAAAGWAARKRRVVAVLFLALSAEILIMGLGFAAPGSDYLPSYWSDFDFFVRLFQEKRMQVTALLHHQEFVSWQRMFGVWMRTACLACVLGILGRRCFCGPR